MMDIFYAIYQTVGAALAMGVLAVIPALYLASIVKYIPWAISAPAMAVIAAVVAYPSGIMEGSQIERVRWEIKTQQLRSLLDDQKKEAAASMLAIEEKYLKSESEKSQLRQGRDDALVNLMRKIPTQIESKNDETGPCSRTPICRPYDMLVDPSILRNIRKR